MAEYSDSAAALLLVFLAILAGILIYEMRKVIRFPVAPVLIIVGFGYQLLGEAIGSHIGVTVDLVEKIDHHLVMIAFMPVLIFETAFA